MANRDEQLLYIHLPAESPLPVLFPEPCRVVVLIEQHVSPEWQSLVSEWIVNQGCLYMMAWGIDCSTWDDSVDWALLNTWNFEDIPDDNFLITTWHENEPMNEAFIHCRLCAFHPTIELPKVAILDITGSPRETEILDRYRRCLDELEDTSKRTLASHLTDWFNRLIKRA